MRGRERKKERDIVWERGKERETDVWGRESERVWKG